MRRTLTDFISSTAEIAQEQNHMIEGISSSLAGVQQVIMMMMMMIVMMMIMIMVAGDGGPQG